MPVQSGLVPGRNVSSTSLNSMVFTLDPKTKFLKPPLYGKFTPSASADKVVPTSDRAPEGPTTPAVTASPYKSFQKVRKPKSADSDSKPKQSWPRRLFSRSGNSENAVADVPEVPKTPSTFRVLSRPPSRDGDFELVQRPSTARISNTGQRLPSQSPRRPAGIPGPPGYNPLPGVDTWPQDYRLPDRTLNLGDFRGRQQVPQHPTRNGSRDVSNRASTDSSRTCGSYTFVELEQFGIHEVSPGGRANPRYDMPHNNQNDYPRGRRAHAELKILPPIPRAESSRLSYATSANFSPGHGSQATQSGPSSPFHPSQPETPVVDGFAEDFDQHYLRIHRESVSSAKLREDFKRVQEEVDNEPYRPPSRQPATPPPWAQRSTTPHEIYSGFTGYSLPTLDQASSPTIRKVPSEKQMPSNAGLSPPLIPDVDTNSYLENIANWADDAREHLPDCSRDHINNLDDFAYLSHRIRKTAIDLNHSVSL